MECNFQQLRGRLEANLSTIARREPTLPAKLLILNKLKLAERVGFVPDEPASINSLGLIGTARNRQIH